MGLGPVPVSVFGLGRENRGAVDALVFLSWTPNYELICFMVCDDKGSASIQVRDSASRQFMASFKSHLFCLSKKVHLLTHSSITSLEVEGAEITLAECLPGQLFSLLV